MIDIMKQEGPMRLIGVSAPIFLIILKIPLREVLLITQRHVVGYRTKGGEGYVKIHDGRACKALRRHGPDGSVL